MDSEFVLILTMWATKKKSAIQMVKGMRTRASSDNCLHWWEEKFGSLNKNMDNKVLPLHHGCNPNDQENLHRLKIQTAFLKIRKMNLRLEINWQWIHSDLDNVSQSETIWNPNGQGNLHKGKFQQLPSLMGREICFLQSNTAGAPGLQSKWSRTYLQFASWQWACQMLLRT